MVMKGAAVRQRPDSMMDIVMSHDKYRRGRCRRGDTDVDKSPIHQYSVVL